MKIQGITLYNLYLLWLSVLIFYASMGVALLHIPFFTKKNPLVWMLILLLFFAASRPAPAQVPAPQAQSMHLLGEPASAEIPFRRINNLILVKVLLDNAIPLEFLLDTGVRTPILTERAYSDLLNINYDRVLSLRGAGENDAVHAYLASSVKMLLTSVQVKNQPLLVLQEDYLELGRYLGVPVHGILGYELFARFVVKIDYDKNLLTLYEPSKFKAPRSFNKLALQIEDSKPYVEAEVVDKEGKRHVLKMLLDTGASHSLLLHTEKTQVSLPDKTLYGNLGRGLLGDISGHIGRVPEFKLSEYTFENVLSSFPDSVSYTVNHQEIDRDGTIGGDVLGRFVVILDYPHNAMYLQKGSSFRDPFIFNKTGMTFVAGGPFLNTFEVVDVRPDTPASRAGIQKKDILYKINGLRTNNTRLKDLGELMRKRDGKKIRLILLRDGEKIKTSFRLCDII